MSEVAVVTAAAWRSRTGGSIHLGEAGSPPRCAGRDPETVAEVRKASIALTDALPAVAEALDRLNLALGLAEIAAEVDPHLLCRRCSGRFARPTPLIPVGVNELGLSEFQREMPSVAESALQEAIDDPPF